MLEGNAHNSDTIYNTLLDEILNLELKPGQSISENELCERFGVSRTPVRTSLARLQSKGLVKVIPYKASTIALLNFDDICQMIYMRAAVESAVLKDFISMTTPMLEEKIKYIIRKQIVLLDGDFEPSEFFTLDSRLHEIWFSVTKRDKLWELIQRSQINYTRFRMLDITATQNFKQLIEEHEKIFEIILKKDFDAVEPIVRHHLNGGINRLSGRIETDFKNYFEIE